MLSFEETPDEIVTQTLVEDAPAGVDDVASEPTEPVTVHEGSTSAARMLELAAVTADQLVADAKTESESLVAAARADAEAISETSRTEAHQVAAELARTKQEQTAELDRERALALAGLAEEKAALEEQIARLRRLQSDHRTQMRDHLEEQLSLLDAAMPVPPAAADD